MDLTEIGLWFYHQRISRLADVIMLSVASGNQIDIFANLRKSLMYATFYPWFYMDMKLGLSLRGEITCVRYLD